MPSYTLMHNLPSGTISRWLAFDRAPDDHAEPGQFVAVSLDGDQAYYAIASSPGEPLELLIKVEGEVAEKLAALEPGATIEATDALGAGFGAAATRPRPLVCLVNGSAIAAVRPVIEAELNAGLPRPVSLFLGVLAPDRTAFADDLARWSERGVDITVVVHSEAEGWEGEVGFVQHAAERGGKVRDDVVVILCGVKPMMDDARELYVAAGLDPAFLLTNY